MTNEVHLNGMNKMGDFSKDKGYLHLSFQVPFVKLVTIILYLHVASSSDLLHSVIKLHGIYMYAHNSVLVHMSSGLWVHAAL